MSLYTYIARTDVGVPTQGQIEAESIEAAQSAIREMNLQVEELHETTLSEQQIVTEETPADASPAPPPALERAYVPLLDTFRIYAGWLLALIGGAYALGAYQVSRDLPFEVPLIEGLLLSPLLLQVALTSYLFLLLSTLHRVLRGGTILGALFAFLGIIIFVLYRMNVE